MTPWWGLPPNNDTSWLLVNISMPEYNLHPCTCIIMQEWSKLAHHVGEPCPVGRSGHAAVCLDYGGDHPQLLVIGGLDNDDKVLSDAWLLDVQSRRWREVR